MVRAIGCNVYGCGLFSMLRAIALALRAALRFARSAHGFSLYSRSMTAAMSGPFQYGSIHRMR